MGVVWEIIGGEDKGGIIVREGMGNTAPKATQRLSTGALVEELELLGDRLRYRLQTGTGPAEGWVAVKVAGKELARRQPPATDNAGTQDAETPAKEHFDPYAILGVATDATDSQIKSAFRKASLKVHPDQNPAADAAEQFRRLTHAKEFLLSPLKRLMYNMAHGLQARRHYIQWWSTWDEIFEEMDPAQEEADAPTSPLSDVLAPSLPDSRTDVLIFGATGIVGTLICSLLPKVMPGRTWAIAGRDERKLMLLEDKFGKGRLYKGKLHMEWPEDLESIVRTARVVIDVSGPKHEVGLVVAEACIRAGTQYIDNTSFPGDTLASKKAYDELHPKALAAGTSLIYFCGIGPVIFDFANWLLVQHMRKTHGLPTRCVDGYEISHGTQITGTVLKSAKGQPGFEKELKKAGFFFLGGEPKSGLKAEDDENKQKAVLDRYAGLWANLSEIPEPITVRCSYGLAGKTGHYGDSFRFKVWMLFGDEAAATMNSLRMGNAFLRRGYEKHLELKKIPSPGEGPCERLRKEAVITRILVAEADEGAPGSGRTAHCICSPGPGGFSDHQEGTALSMIETAACVLDVLDGGLGGSLQPGFGTPTHHLSRFGFVERLAARGFTFSIKEGSPARELFQNYMSSAGALAS